MKKTFLLFLSYFFAFVCANTKIQNNGFNNQCLFYSATYDVTTIISDDYDYNFNTLMSDYFYKLSYYPSNINGCCGYVGMCMLLSYCNYVYDDDFIGPNFEYRPEINFSENISDVFFSPGTYNYINSTYFPTAQNLLPNNITDGQTFANAFYQTNPDCFLAYLYDFAYTNVDATSFAWEQNNGFQTNGEIIHDTLIAYLNYKDSALADDYYLVGNDFDGNGNLSLNDVKLLSNANNEAYISNIKLLIDSGYPVLVGGYNDDALGHVAIVYDYEDDKLIANDGNGNNKFEFNVEYPYIATYYTIVPKSKSFLINWDFAPYYQIQLSPTTYANYYHPLLSSHSHCGVSFAYYNTLQHIVTCYCDYEFYENHNMKKISTTRYACKDCGYILIA